MIIGNIGNPDDSYDSYDIKDILSIIFNDYTKIECKGRIVNKIIASERVYKIVIHHTKGEKLLINAVLFLDKEMNDGFYVLE